MRTRIVHPARRTDAASGFTLVELLVVVAIIGILAGLTYAAIDSAYERAKIAQTRTLIHAVSSGLQMFKSDFGRLPGDNDDGDGEITNDPEFMRLWLLGIDDKGDPDEQTGPQSSRDVRAQVNWNGAYVELSLKKHVIADYEYTDPERNWTEEWDYVIVDAWDQRLYFETYDASVTSPLYTHRPIHNIDKWDVWSRGPDGRGTDDDADQHGWGMDMGDFHGPYPDRLEDYDTYEDLKTGQRSNRDNIGNF